MLGSASKYILCLLYATVGSFPKRHRGCSVFFFFFFSNHASLEPFLS